MTVPASISRRRFLKRSFAFSAASLLAGCTGGINFPEASADPVDGGTAHFLMVGDWGEEGTTKDQSVIALAMQTYAAKWSIDTDALLMLGDNFYGNLPNGVTDARWQLQFELMYPASSFPGPALAVPGNHDYQYSPASKVEAELAYALAGNTRWTMPNEYYTQTFPSPSPLVELIALDSNMPNEPAQPWPPPNPSFYTMSDQQRLDQLAWLTAVLQRPKTTPFRIVIGHHPIYSNGTHGDNGTLIRDWDPLFRQYGVDLYLAGHDHDLQHIEIAGHTTSFVTSGAGGAPLTPFTVLPASRGPFGDKVHGFTHLQVHPDSFVLRHLDGNGGLLHKFTKTISGVLSIQK